MLKTYSIPSIDIYGIRHTIFLGNIPGLYKGADVGDYVGSMTGIGIPDSVSLRVREILEKSPSDKIYSLISAVQAWETWGLNRNGDSFKREDLLKDYKTYETHGRVYWRHNKFGNGPFGKVIAAFYDNDMDRVLVLAQIDLGRAGRIAKEALDHILNDYPVLTSMGVKPEYDICTKCGHIAKTWSEHCDHVRNHLHEDLPGDWWLAPPVGMINKNNIFKDISIVFTNAWRGSFAIANSTNPKDVLVYPWMSIYDAVKPEPRRPVFLISKEAEATSPRGRYVPPEILARKANERIRLKEIQQASVLDAIDIGYLRKINKYIDALTYWPKVLIPIYSGLNPVDPSVDALKSLGSMLVTGAFRPIDITVMVLSLSNSLSPEIKKAYMRGLPIQIEPGMNIPGAFIDTLMDLCDLFENYSLDKLIKHSERIGRSPDDLMKNAQRSLMMSPAEMQQNIQAYLKAHQIVTRARRARENMQKATAIGASLLSIPVAIGLMKKYGIDFNLLDPRHLALLMLAMSLAGGVGHAVGTTVANTAGTPEEIAARYISSSMKVGEGNVMNWKNMLAAFGLGGVLNTLGTNYLVLRDMNKGEKPGAALSFASDHPWITFALGGAAGIGLLKIAPKGFRIIRERMKEADAGIAEPLMAESGTGNPFLDLKIHLEKYREVRS